MKTSRNITLFISILAAGISAALILRAQEETATPVQGGTISSAAINDDVSGLSDLDVELRAVEMTTPTPAADVPQDGTFWSAQHAPGSAEEWPPLPGNWLSLPVWEVDTNLFLVDDLNYDYNAVAKTTLKARSGMSAMDLSPDDDGGSFSPMFSIADYSTNLWLQITNLASHTAGLLLSNTIADVQYEIQGVANLTDTNWISEGFVLGSELTNWTPTSVAATNYPTLFLRVRSWQDSDGSGLPDWWQLQYFGHTGVDPYADPDGDGWNNLQEYQNGTNPNSFNTPPTPQGLSAFYNPANGAVSVTWQSSPASVVSYTVEKYDAQANDYSGSTTDFTVYAPTTDLADSVAGETPYNTANFGVSLNVNYKIQAHYSGGNSSWSDNIPLQPHNLSSVPYGAFNSNPLYFISGPKGASYLAAQTLPPGTAFLRLTRNDYYQVYIAGNEFASVDTNFDIPVSAFTNGLCLLPASINELPDSYGVSYYEWFVQAINTNGSSAGGTLLGYGYNVLTRNLNGYLGILSQGWVTPPYFDGRAQLKQNLIFSLRAATVDAPFNFNDNYSAFSIGETNPPNYVCSSLYDFAPLNEYGGGIVVLSSLNVMLPFENNYTYRNFVFNSAEMDGGGRLTNGASGDTIYDMALTEPATHQFQFPLTNNAVIPSLLATNQTRWLCSYPLDAPIYDGTLGADLDTPYLAEIGCDDILSAEDFTTHCQMFSGVKNIYGLSFLSAAVTAGGTPGVVSAGGTLSDDYGSYFYPETAQPQFGTAEYDFWNLPLSYGQYIGTNAIPGMDNFSTARASDLLIASVGDPNFNVVGYAKLPIQNGYSGVYGYLAQYFDKAYQITNGIVTTNQTGILSSYGNFFATQPGPVALVTMPDIDTSARGTATVYCVSLVLDKNRDGTMDASFSGQDATSGGSPDRIWMNNDYDFSSGSTDPFGHDVESQYNANYKDPAITCPRDLEDYFRLWICGMPPLPAGQGYSVTMSMSAISGNPAINMVNAVETNGGTLYLTDTNTAFAQVADSMGLGYGQKYQTISSANSITLPANMFTNSGNKYFLFEGAGIGEGQLTMTISQNGNTIAQTSAYLDLHDIKDFYERAVITDNISGAISNWTSTLESVQSATSSALGNDTNLIVMVHGFNVGDWDWLNDSETVFKRLYWSGYQGKFMTVKWPCEPVTSWTFITVDTSIFNDSEIKSYKAGSSLKNYLSQLRSRFPNYQLNVLAHSQGNAIMGEAIEQGAPFDTYILTQGAMPASSYDVNAATDSTLLAAEAVYGTPEWQPTGYHGVYTNMTGKIVSYYNPNDSVLNVWNADQAAGKPDGYAKNILAASPYYTYDGANGSHHSLFNIFTYLVTDPQESRAMISRSRTQPVGRQDTSGVIDSTIDLNAHFGFTTGFSEHSAEWTRPLQTSRPYYVQILTTIAP